jgi:tetratricopeptide (TPR) repeat protein
LSPSPIRRVFVSGLLVLAACAGVVQAPRAMTTDAGLIEGLVAAGKLDEAIDAGRTGIAQAADNVDLRYALAKALAAKGRRTERVVNVPKESANTTLRLTAADFKNAEFSVGYDAALYEEAVLHLGEALRRAPGRKDIRMTQCFLLTDGARIERAAAALGEAIRTLPAEPRLPEELARFGAERTKRGDAAGGAALLGIVAKAFPSHAEVQADHGLSLARLGRRDDALAALDRAAALKPKDASLLRRRAIAALILRDYGRAQKAYDAAFAASRDDQDRFGAAVAAYGRDPKASAPIFRDLATPSPSASPALVQLAAEFASAAHDGAASPSAMALAARAAKDGQEVLALPVYDRALAAAPSNAAARQGLAGVYRALGCPAIAAQVERAP